MQTGEKPVVLTSALSESVIALDRRRVRKQDNPVTGVDFPHQLVPGAFVEGMFLPRGSGVALPGGVRVGVGIHRHCSH